MPSKALFHVREAFSVLRSTLLPRKGLFLPRISFEISFKKLLGTRTRTVGSPSLRTPLLHWSNPIWGGQTSYSEASSPPPGASEKRRRPLVPLLFAVL